MDVYLSENVDDKEQLQVEETDDSCTVDSTEIVPLSRDTDGTMVCVTGDCSAEVRQENLAVVKQEPGDVCHVIDLVFSFSQAKNRKYCADPLQEVMLLKRQ